MGRNRAITTVVAALVTVQSVVAQQLVEVAYSFRRGNGPGGVATAQVDAKSGKILGQSILFEHQSCSKPKKLRRSADRKLLVLSNESKNGPHVFLIKRGAGREAEAKGLTLGMDQPDELRVAGRFALVTAEDDHIYQIDLQREEVRVALDVEMMFDPPANAPQDIFVLPDKKHAVVSFQKDSKTGRKRGNRLAIFSYPDMKNVADIPLERNREDLHIQRNKKEQGPGPEIVYVSEDTNTLLATLDLYGAVAVMDWDAAENGILDNCEYLSTSLDGSWGNSFPDRAMPLPDGKHVLVCNAGKDGGAVLIDLQKRAILWRAKTPPGLDTPVYIAGLGKAYAVCPGKIKERDEQEAVVTKTYVPQAAICVFDFKTETVRTIETTPYQTFSLAPIAAGNNILIVAVGNGTATELLTFDAANDRIMDDAKKAIGTVEQFERD